MREIKHFGISPQNIPLYLWHGTLFAFPKPTSQIIPDLLVEIDSHDRDKLPEILNSLNLPLPSL